VKMSRGLGRRGGLGFAAALMGRAGRRLVWLEHVRWLAKIRCGRPLTSLILGGSDPVQQSDRRELL
jgi:hypothetical protein